MMDNKLKSLLGMEMLSPENAIHIQRLKDILDCFELKQNLTGQQYSNLFLLR